MKLPDTSDKGETWHATFADKKKIYGTARVNVTDSQDKEEPNG